MSQFADVSDIPVGGAVPAARLIGNRDRLIGGRWLNARAVAALWDNPAAKAELEGLGLAEITPAERPDPRTTVAGALTYTWDGETVVAAYQTAERPLEGIAADLKRRVDAERDRRRYPGDVDTGLGWPVDLRNDCDERNITGTVMAAVTLAMDGAPGAVIKFMGADNVDRTLIPAEMIAVGQAAQAHIAAVYDASWAVKAAIDAAVAADDRAALLAIDPVGW